MNRSARVTFVSVSAALAIGIVAACGGGGSTTACNNGDTRQCVGAGSCAGGQSCSGGAWSACDCGGTNDGGTDGTTTNDGATSDSGPDITPYVANCPQVTGTAPMVEIPAQGGGSFCIDTREVTASEFDPQRGGTLFLDWPQVAACGQNYSPFLCQPSERTKQDAPANCVSWCDAAAFCALRKKRLCDPAEMKAGCMAGGMDFPWGLDVGSTLKSCFVTTPVPASQSQCHPSIPPQVFVQDLVGNIREWSGIPNTRTEYPDGAPYKSGSLVCGVMSSGTGNGKIEGAGVGFRCCANTK